MGQEQSTNKEEESESEYYSDQANINNRPNQLNPNNDAYWKSRRYPERPDDWEDRVAIKLPRGNDDNRSDQLNPNNRKYWSSRGNEKSSTSVVPQSSSKQEFQLDGDSITTGLEVAGLIYGAYQIHNKLSQIVEDRNETDPRRQRRSSTERFGQDVMDGLELAANVGLFAYGGYQLYKKFSEEMEDDNEKHLEIKK